MPLTVAQAATLKANILAETDVDFVAARTAGDHGLMAAFYNADTNPAFIVWKSTVTTMQMGRAMKATELAGLTTANTNRLQVLAAFAGGSFVPSDQEMRDGFNDIFGGAGGVNTRAALLALWKRTAKRGEKIFATGTGSDASPATLVFEGSITVNDIVLAYQQ